MAATDLLEMFKKIVPVCAIEKKETIAKCCVHSPVFLPSTKRQGTICGRSNKWKTSHLWGWIQHQVWGWVHHQLRGWARRQPHLLTQRRHTPSTKPHVSINTKWGTIPRYRQYKTINPRQTCQCQLPRQTYQPLRWQDNWDDKTIGTMKPSKRFSQILLACKSGRGTVGKFRFLCSIPSSDCWRTCRGSSPLMDRYTMCQWHGLGTCFWRWKVRSWGPVTQWVQGAFDSSQIFCHQVLRMLTFLDPHLRFVGCLGWSRSGE